MKAKGFYSFFPALALMFGTSCSEQPLPPSVKTAEFKTWGNCDMCKKTIEKSVGDLDGLVKADWNVKTKMMTVSYDTAKVQLAEIQQKIAAAGYDNEAFRGDDEAYTNLHHCCQYDRKD